MASRDARQHRQRELLAAHGQPVVSFTVVSPGEVKSSPQVVRVFEWGLLAVLRELKGRRWGIRESLEVRAGTGPEWLASIEADPRELKMVLLKLEDQHPVGRLWDVDVVTLDGLLGRAEFGIPPRQCLVCHGEARSCARSRAHGLDDLLAAWRSLASAAGECDDAELGAFSAEEVGALASEALRVEARLTPKPGLVDSANNGSHADLDLGAMLASADALEPFFIELAKAGRDAAAARGLGVRAEEAMRAATGGANAHQGAIYSLGLISAVAATSRSVGELCAAAAEMAGEILALNDAPGASTRPAARELRLGGAREEALSGFSTVREVALPKYELRLAQGWRSDDALLTALLALMSVTEDTNLVQRGGKRALTVVKRWAQAADCQVTDGAVLRSLLALADEGFRARSWSPGGSADLLAITWFIAQLKAR